MTTLSIAEKNKIRADLRSANITARGMTDAEMIAKHNELFAETPEQPQAPQFEQRGDALVETQQPQPQEQPQPMPTQPHDTETLTKLAELLDSLAPKPQQAPAFDEAQLIDLIKQYGTTTLKINDTAGLPVTAIKGAHKSLEKVVKLLNVGVMPYLVGPAGSGKTTLAIQAAEALDLKFYSTGAVIAPYELTGHTDAHSNYVPTALRNAYEHGGVFLADEMDACSPRALIAINQLLSNPTFTFPDKVVEKHINFKFIAAANTTGHGATREYCARTPLDGATLDRFVLIDIDYDTNLEDRVATAHFEAAGGLDTKTLATWLVRVKMAREAAQKLKISVLITPRASMYGASMLAAGFELAELDEMVLFKGLAEDAKTQLLGAL